MSRKKKLCVRKLIFCWFPILCCDGEQFNLLSSKFSLWFVWPGRVTCRWQFWQHHDDWVQEREQPLKLPNSSTVDYRLPNRCMPEWYSLLQPTNSTAIVNEYGNENEIRLIEHYVKQHGKICCTFRATKNNAQLKSILTTMVFSSFGTHKCLVRPHTLTFTVDSSSHTSSYAFSCMPVQFSGLKITFETIGKP